MYGWGAQATSSIKQPFDSLPEFIGGVQLILKRSLIAALLCSVLPACGGGGANDLPVHATPVEHISSPDVKVTLDTAKNAATFHINLSTSQRFRATQSVGRAGEVVRGLRVAGKFRDYWFGEDAKITRYDKYLIIRGYNGTFVYPKSDVRVIDNESGSDKGGIPEERGIPVATSLASGRIHQASRTAACPDCLALTPPGPGRVGRSQQANRRTSLLIDMPYCDSSIPGSCDGCNSDPFFSSCCDVTSVDSCNGGDSGGYYDPNGVWVSDPCASYLWDADYYSLCQSLNGNQLGIIPLMNPFKSPGIKHYNWYFDSFTAMDVLHDPVSNVVLTWNWSLNDLFHGRIFLQNIPMAPGAAALGEWCFYMNGTSAFNSSTVWVNNPGGTQVGAWSATLATITGVTNPDRCPI